MANFESFMARHGEIGVQAIIETMEKNAGQPTRSDVSLEERWDAAMRAPAAADSRMVA